MEAYADIRNKLLDINRDLRHIIQEALSIDGLSSHPVNSWQETTARIERQLAEETIRIAVVGSIKSGKSTLTNSLFGDDYVKRGAGVVTSIITKVRPGRDLRARLEFKTWEDINAEINQALVLFSTRPSDANHGRDTFDITNDEDRQRLEEDLSRLNSEQLISEDARDPNSVLLSEYLKGYDRVKGLVSYEPITHVLESKDFYKQKDFVGNESLAVYLKDVQLTLAVPDNFGEDLEIADCQGSDSPNPLHLVTIQDYLIQTHLINYVLSSRTGMRQADIKFLNLIKKIGLTKNILFVLNVDFSEHEDLADLKQLTERVKEEIGLIVPSPRVFAFSTLYNLFKSLDAKGSAEQVLSRKDRLRLEQWREEKDMITLSDEETERFLKATIEKISHDRFTLLLESNLERISTVSSGMRDWVQISQDLLKKDTGRIYEAFVEMDRRKEASDQITAVIKDTLDGTTRKLKQELGTNVERFFDPQYGEIVQDIIGFIESYDLATRDYEKALETSGFLTALYRIFQTLQQGANRFIAESITPSLINFVREEENKLEDVFEQVSGPYSLMIKDAVNQYQRTMKELGIEIPERPFKAVRAPDVASVKSDAQLSIPRLATTMRYTTRIKTEAILRLGFYNTLKTVRKLLKKPVSEGSQSAIRSLEDSVRRIKEEMEQSIREHFMDYKENLKYQYIFKLVDTISDRLYESVIDRMGAFSGSLLDMKGLIEKEQLAKDDLLEEFASMGRSLDGVLGRIKEVELEVARSERL
jgi:hypothetical protein